MTFLVTILSAFSGAFLGVLLGGVGEVRANRRRLSELESDITSVDERLTREQKRRAGVALQDGRKSNMEEAAEIAARSKAVPVQIKLPGRSVFGE